MEEGHFVLISCVNRPLLLCSLCFRCGVCVRLSLQDPSATRVGVTVTFLTCVVPGLVLGAVKAERLFPAFREFSLRWWGTLGCRGYFY